MMHAQSATRDLSAYFPNKVHRSARNVPFDSAVPVAARTALFAQRDSIWLKIRLTKVNYSTIRQNTASNVHQIQLALQAHPSKHCLSILDIGEILPIPPSYINALTRKSVIVQQHLSGNIYKTEKILTANRGTKVHYARFVKIQRNISVDQKEFAKNARQLLISSSFVFWS